MRDILIVWLSLQGATTFAAGSIWELPLRRRSSILLAQEVSSTLYTPFLEQSLALLAEYGVRLLPYPIAEELRRREGLAGSSSQRQRVLITASAYSAEKLRNIRVVHLQGGPSLQVLNLCIFPSLDTPLPTFAADLVTLPGGHLFAIDCQPNGMALSDYAQFDAGASALRHAHKLHRPRLPDGGAIPDDAARFFSPLLLWSRLPNTKTSHVRSMVLPAFEDYLRGYLQLVADAPQLRDPNTLLCVRQAQLEYALYRTEKDPARGMLTRLFGAAFTERLLREVLFDLPMWLDRNSSDNSWSHGDGRQAKRS
mmetsp:Transcript_49984/g.82885  ORF Transcript_49984/g.82885 Transcript_49984/m.82885 type:complete len:310 (+) Transcript_49984:81-1010(+)|eukprot:CAMPEP_0119315180 /NCGR_PEP_ID=MMETSP1333-20130426/34724_1 /TAXON_ID=418940 /ORGANISM="Scyphosphaera apsteinii, Strain RCC1455" /LENGTH=309 /DNA_ID=CAMNT_0007320449 /DNA_START=81 /DNA_END=1010 /DNA_ORIENTATION=+